MVKNRKLAQSIQSSGWGMFVEMCKYKGEWSGKNILQIPTFQPSTKICSTCGHTNRTLTLSPSITTCLPFVSHRTMSPLCVYPHPFEPLGSYTSNTTLDSAPTNPPPTLPKSTQQIHDQRSLAQSIV